MTMYKKHLPKRGVASVVLIALSTHSLC